MDVLFSSFGTNVSGDRSATSFFRDMPPFQYSVASGQFLPDLTMLLVSNKLIFDEVTFQRLLENESESFSTYRELLVQLNKSGFLHVENFGEILKKNTSTVRDLVETDLRQLERFETAMIHSSEIWRNELGDLMLGNNGELENEIGEYAPSGREWNYLLATARHFQGAVSSHLVSDIEWRRRTGSRMYGQTPVSDSFAATCRPYLEYTNANVVLSKALNAGLYDWSDMGPFYHQKSGYFADGFDMQTLSAQETTNKLFSLVFPEILELSVAEIMKVLTDKRIQSLRRLIDDLIISHVEIDEGYVVDLLKGIVNSELKLHRQKSLVSYATMPIGLLPVVGPVAQKGAEELASFDRSGKLREDHGWFYLFNEVSKARNSPSRFWSRNRGK